MTIDEAIDYVDDVNATVTWREGQENDEALFDNLADWLEELKDYRSKNKMVVKIDMLNVDEVKNKVTEAYQQGRADAIEEVKSKMISFHTDAIFRYGTDIIEARADAFNELKDWLKEQLKTEDGGKE